MWSSAESPGDNTLLSLPENMEYLLLKAAGRRCLYSQSTEGKELLDVTWAANKAAQG